MSVAEIKAESQHLTPSETLHLAAWFKALSQHNTPSRLAELDAIWHDMEQGHKMSLDEVRNLVSSLEKSGA
ncbi:hypothetical protein OpiT1DRAFT_05006 [Opitutaceae bacterium TAV1]|nr:hypothetical protein OPIT5_24310 [Opitutaceae bacterium TAV5]EIQ00461.1 hypothetical protein OpiT1DRAFT_05006 [Opitutaceae bacterium TAV1]